MRRFCAPHALGWCREHVRDSRAAPVSLNVRAPVGVENPDLRDWVRLLAPLEVKVASAAVRAWVGGVGECGGEEAVGPVFGVAA